MSDKAFQIGMTAATVVAIVLIVLLGLIWSWLFAFLIGIVYEIIVGGLLLRIWGRSYMERQLLT
ncbi:hypothetical protein ACFLX5_01750 [Chloroflexota bacterium]